MHEVVEHVRICHFCEIRFLSKGNGCPKCNRGSFFSMRIGDIGTAMYLNDIGPNWEIRIPLVKNG